MVKQFNLTGIFLGLCTFVLIGLFHPIIIKTEYYCGVKVWWIFLLFGICGIVASLFINNIFWSSLSAVFAVCCFWSIKELFEQQKRVSKGWFPKRMKEK